jgi:hypothetical protein
MMGSSGESPFDVDRDDRSDGPDVATGGLGSPDSFEAVRAPGTALSGDAAVEEALFVGLTDAVRVLKEECWRVERLLVLARDIMGPDPLEDVGDLDRELAAEQEFDAQRRHYGRMLTRTLREEGRGV